FITDEWRLSCRIISAVSLFLGSALFAICVVRRQKCTMMRCHGNRLSGAQPRETHPALAQWILWS
ncbi:uncharacterized, partial [Tachysurus ichikawai]